MSETEGTKPTNGVTVLEKLTERIDKTLEYILQIKDDMYTRADWKTDSERIYSTLQSGLAEMSRRLDSVEGHYASKESVDAINIQLLQLVPRTEHQARWELEARRAGELEGRLKLVEGRTLPRPVVTGLATALGAAGAWLVQKLLGLFTLPHAGTH
jgi:hypothetical protein